MKADRFEFKRVAVTVALAVVFWFAAFALPRGVFWLKISVAALVLATLACIFQPVRNLRFSCNWKNILIGLFSAAVLYLIFWVGQAVSTAILPFAGEQIDAVYGKDADTPKWLIMVLLF